ncbi:MAG: VOC family protein, partial [Muribaculaceae bacterium]|nr:VOC family protein [Muribaculaceae bacterium]
MDIKMHFDHFNINVMDLDASLAFYKENLGLSEVGEKRASDGSFILKYLSSPGNDFRLELTWLRDHKGPYELGENESHLALRFDGDYDAIREFHRKNGVIC